MAFETLDIFTQTPESREGKTAFVEKRPPDFSQFRESRTD